MHLNVLRLPSLNLPDLLSILPTAPYSASLNLPDLLSILPTKPCPAHLASGPVRAEPMQPRPWAGCSTAERLSPLDRTHAQIHLLVYTARLHVLGWAGRDVQDTPSGGQRARSGSRQQSMRGSGIGAVRAYSRHGQSMQAAFRHRAIEPAWIHPDRYHLNMSVQPNNISETPCGPMLKHGRRVAVDCLTVSERH